MVRYYNIFGGLTIINKVIGSEIVRSPCIKKGLNLSYYECPTSRLATAWEVTEL